MEDLEPGWYPDPRGGDAFRYWDGSAWSSVTTDDPGQPPPRPPGPRRAQTSEPTSSHTRLILAIVTAVVVLAVAGGMAAARFGATQDPEPPDATRVGTAASDPYDQSISPGPEATTPSAESTARAENVACPRGNPNDRSKHPDDGRVHGGGWSFPAIDGFDPAGPESRLTFAWDVAQQVTSVSADPNWIAQAAVGELRESDGFDRDAQRTAEEVMDCVVSSDLYRLYTGLGQDTSSAAIEVAGRAGWRIEADVTVSQPGLTFPGDHVTIIVAPNDDGWNLFFAATPIGNAALAKAVGGAASNLRVD